MNAALEAVAASDVRPFAIAGGVVLVLAVIEMVTTMVGFSMSQIHVHAFEVDANAGSGIAGLLLWINAGRVPLMILIFLALGLFAIEGFLLQGIVHSFGASLPAWIASIIAVAGTVPLIRMGTAAISRLIPRDETYAVDQADFVGRVATVAVGPLDQGLPGRVTVVDANGNLHSLAARAAPNSAPLGDGARVLLVDRDDTGFIAILAPAELSRQPKQ